MNLFAQTTVEHVLNTLPEGLLLAACAWLLLRLLPRQNSSTRFAIWLVALAGVAGLPFLGAIRNGASVLPQTHPEITLSPFWAAAFLLLWIPITLLALARLVAGIWQVRRIRRSCSEVSLADLDPLLRQLFADLNRPVRLLISDRARVPAALGFRHPAVVLPAWSLHDLPADQLRHILIHELAHIRRHDDWTNLLQKVTRAIFFFHPAVWWIDARLSLEREMACDEAVLAATGNPRAYAGCLIDLIERGCARRGWTMAQAAVARARDASVRIAHILQRSQPASTRLGRKALGLAAGLSLACSGVVLCSPGLISFAPLRAQGSESALAARTLAAAHLSEPRVVPAMYRPGRAESRPSAHQLSLHSASLNRPQRKQTTQTRLALYRKTRERGVPVVEASLKVAPRTQPWMTSAYLIIESAEEYAPTPTQVSTEMVPASTDEGSVLRVQTVQVVRQDASGIHVQIFRLVMRVPAAIAMEGTAQSI
ncbi:MAG TPA: M56 family metallopeptidase [Acidobacteriaceae bacterium]|jgi:beta-lactamase regulating signal transducer with metallopeptidase domain|nr:M56 family metallopeptidase [Acidobacteriaceae bacterium]